MSKQETKQQPGPRSELHGFRDQYSRQSMIMPVEELGAYRDFCNECHAFWQAKGFDEEQLVCTIANTQWQLNRTQAIANNMLAVEYTEQLDRFQTQNAETHTALVTAHAVRDITAELGRLALITQRLARQLHHDRKELRSVQATREVKTADVPVQAGEEVPPPGRVPVVHPVTADAVKNPTVVWPLPLHVPAAAS